MKLDLRWHRTDTLFPDQSSGSVELGPTADVHPAEALESLPRLPSDSAQRRLEYEAFRRRIDRTHGLALVGLLVVGSIATLVAGSGPSDSVLAAVGFAVLVLCVLGVVAVVGLWVAARSRGRIPQLKADVQTGSVAGETGPLDPIPPYLAEELLVRYRTAPPVDESDQRRLAYARRRRAEQRFFGLAALACALLVAVGCGISGSAIVESSASNTAGKLITVGMFALLAVFCAYVYRRGASSRLDAESGRATMPIAQFQGSTHPAGSLPPPVQPPQPPAPVRVPDVTGGLPDPYPADRLLPSADERGAGRRTAGAALLMSVLPWVVVFKYDVHVRGLGFVLMALVSAGCAAFTVWNWRAQRRQAIVEQPDGLLVISTLGRRLIPWSDVTGFRIENVNNGRQGGWCFPCLLVTRQGAQRTCVTFSFEDSSRCRDFVAHNARVIARWATDHSLSLDPKFGPVIDFANGPNGATTAVRDLREIDGQQIPWWLHRHPSDPGDVPPTPMT